jgi:co-chaperonin GroES (HSP10)
MNSGGDVLARGGKSAQFAAGSSRVDDPIQFNKSVALEEAPIKDDLGNLVSVIDRRPNYLSEPVDIKVVKLEEEKYPEKKYGHFSPILDRILVKRCPEDKDMELLEDGSVRNKKNGLIIAAKYRQHSNVGIVLATGAFVVIGNVRVPMEEVVRIGDRVTYGDYNSEVFPMKEDKVRELCDKVQMNYFPDDTGVRVVRVQDVRGIEREVKSNE